MEEEKMGINEINIKIDAIRMMQPGADRNIQLRECENFIMDALFNRAVTQEVFDDKYREARSLFCHHT